MPSPLPPAIPPQFRLPPHSSPPRAQLSSYKDSAGHPALGEALFEAAEAGAAILHLHAAPHRLPQRTTPAHRELVRGAMPVNSPRPQSSKARRKPFNTAGLATGR